MSAPDLFHVPVVLFLATLVIYWFHSSLPVSLTKILRVAGWHKHNDAFWPPATEYTSWIRSQWAIWYNVQRARTKGWRFYLLYIPQCPYCLAFHLSWFTGLLIWGVAGWAQALWVVCYPCIILILKRLGHE